MFKVRFLIMASLLSLSCSKGKSAAETPTPEITTSPYEFTKLNLTSPPFDGTIFITGDIITQEDPSLFQSLSYSGTGVRTMFDRRNGGRWVTLEPHLFPTIFSDGLTTEIQINPEFSAEEAAIQAEKYAFLIGQLPTELRKDVETMWIHKGEEAYGGGNKNILVHTGMTTFYENFGTGIVEETLIHEAAHTSIDGMTYGTQEWLNAATDDGNYISTYAADYPFREDIAELFLLYIAVKYFPDRISNTIANKTLSSSLNRILFFDNQGYDMSLYE